MRIWMVGMVYTVAFIAALVTIWMFMSLRVSAFFEGVTDSLAPSMLLPVLAGLCVFSLIYGVISGRALKLRFWVVVPVLLMVLLFGATELVWRGYVSFLEAVMGIVLLVFVSGFLACLRRDAITSMPKDVSEL